jgi:cell division protein ZapB
MSQSIFHKLEARVDAALETIELLRLQLEDQEEHNKTLLTENANLKNKQIEWEHDLATLLRKLEGADLRFGKTEASKTEELEAL